MKASFGTFNRDTRATGGRRAGINLDGMTPASADSTRSSEFQSKTDRRKIARAQAQLTTWFSTKCPYY